MLYDGAIRGKIYHFFGKARKCEGIGKEQKMMKGYQKRLLAIAFTMVLAMSNVLIASADGNATMIQRQEVVEGHSAITADRTTNAVLNVKRKDDTFKVYDLTKITWDDSTGVLNATIEWNDAVKTFLAGNTEFSGDQFSTPEKLGAADRKSVM